MVELQAFEQIGRSWRALGYPFASLTPSYAAAIGASGDRPVALAKLIGIIANQGKTLPTQSMVSLEFAKDTPYQTRLAHAPTPPSAILSPTIAEVVHQLLRDVVLGGTAKRLSDGITLPGGRTLEVYGKTGTGDQRFNVFARGARLIESRKVNRTATFVFVIGDRFFGTLTAYVHEPYAAHYEFTSALSVQLLKSLAPALQSLLEGDRNPPVALSAASGSDGRRADAGSSAENDAAPTSPNTTWAMKPIQSLASANHGRQRIMP
jgi:membrane peptidoglycan carboxypeptidase